MILCTCGATLFGVPQVGVPIAEITVPTESVTVLPIQKTVKEKDVSRTIPDVILTQQDLFDCVRNKKDLNERIVALNEILDQELIFKLFFKPGEDCNAKIRKLVLSRMVEVELVKVIAEKIKVQELREAAMARIKSIYANDCEVKPDKESQVARFYVQRMRCLK
jgi:hypothetical protein